MIPGTEAFSYVLSLLRVRTWLLMAAFLVTAFSGRAQNQALADSLEQVLKNKAYAPEEYLNILKELASNSADPDKILTYSDQLIDLARQADSTAQLYLGYLHRGNALRMKSELSKALESYFQAARIASDKGLIGYLGMVDVTIADVYSIMGNHQNAVHYYQEAIDILREEKDSINLGSALNNAGDEYFNYGKLDSALAYFQQAEAIFQAKDYEIGVAYSLGSIGMVYAEQRQDSLAQVNINQAVSSLEALEDYYPISVFLLYMADIYLRKEDFATAISYAERSLDLAAKYGLKEQLGDAHQKLSEIYEESGDYAQALEHYRDHITYRDSVQNIETVRRLANLRTDYEVSQKQIEIDLLEKESEIQRLRQSRQEKLNYVSGIALIAILLLVFGMYRRYRYIKRTTAIIEEEKNRSDMLLRNILPAGTAKELKEKGKVRATKFDSVTVMFTDFKEFTNLSTRFSPEKLVESIDLYFSRFDAIMEKYGLEKIKTVGDAYMCAGGLPFVSDDHAHKMLLAAFEMLDFVREVKAREEDGLAHFDIRIGINTGPVIAGVVGTKKFAYDIWGDTVNIAARMESAGVAGKINISEMTYEQVKDDFYCQYRGVVNVRNKGEMKMYFVTGVKGNTDRPGKAIS